MSATDAITALIPAAGRVPDSVIALSNVTSPAMIPVAGRPVIQWTIDYLHSIGIRRFKIAVPTRGLFVEEFVECVFGDDCDVEFVVPSSDRGVGWTVKELADRVDTSSTLVVLGDTHFKFADPSVLLDGRPFVLIDHVEESYRWCVADSDSDGNLATLHDKVPDLTPPLDALIGVYFFPSTAQLRAAALDAAEQSTRVEMAAILRTLMRDHEIRAVRAREWLDCGNADRQVESQRVLLRQRAFNEISLDPVFGTLTKRSRNTAKFVDEINYLRLLPPELSVLFPRVVASSAEWDDAYLTMEFHGYPTLAELFVFENVDAAIWRRVFDHLRQVIERGFLAHRRPLPPGAVRSMYMEKPRERLASIEGPARLTKLVHHDGPITVNDRELANLPQLWDQLDDAVASIAASAEGAVVHGDLCFSNILYDLRSGTCKLIDPRGSFGAPGIFGDPRYDVAKLSHSVHGLYDFITADLFRLAVDGTTLTLSIRSRPHHHRVAAAFDEVFASFDLLYEIPLIAGLIFVGLAPLHYDAPDRQIAFYVRGLELINDALAKR